MSISTTFWWPVSSKPTGRRSAAPNSQMILKTSSSKSSVTMAKRDQLSKRLDNILGCKNHFRSRIIANFWWRSSRRRGLPRQLIPHPETRITPEGTRCSIWWGRPQRIWRFTSSTIWLITTSTLLQVWYSRSSIISILTTLSQSWVYRQISTKNTSECKWRVLT